MFLKWNDYDVEISIFYERYVKWFLAFFRNDFKFITYSDSSVWVKWKNPMVTTEVENVSAWHNPLKKA